MSKREWDNPIRGPWNPVIHSLLKAIDNHVMLYLKTKKYWHLKKAQDLRVYVKDLKDFIKSEEDREGVDKGSDHRV